MFNKPSLLSLITGLIFAISFFSPLEAQSLSSQDTTDEPPFIFGGLAWSLDGEIVAVGTSNGVWMHNASDLSVVGKLADQIVVTSLDWSPQASHLVIGGEDGTLEIWDADTQRRITKLAGHTSVVSSVVWSPDGKLVASSSYDTSIRIWDAQTEEPLQVFKPTTYHQLYPLTWSPDGKYIATQLIRSNYTGIVIWDVGSADIQLTWPNNIETFAVKWSPDGELIAGAGWSSEFRLWSASTGFLLRNFDVGGFASVNMLAWSPDSKRLATSSSFANENSDGEIYQTYATQIWDIETGEATVVSDDAIVTGDAFYTNALAWSLDGRQLASTSDDGKVFIWDTTTTALVAVYEGYKSIILTN